MGFVLIRMPFGVWMFATPPPFYVINNGLGPSSGPRPPYWDVAAVAGDTRVPLAGRKWVQPRRVSYCVKAVVHARNSLPNCFEPDAREQPLPNNWAGQSIVTY